MCLTKINPFNNSTKPSKGMRFFSIEYSDLKRAQKLYQQEYFWMLFFTQANLNLWRSSIDLKANIHSWVKDKNSYEKTQKLKFFSNRYWVCEEQ